MTHRMIVKDAKELAGQYYEKERSEKFRTTWPVQMDYVEVNWQNFVEAVRRAYAELLTQDFVSQDDKDAIYDALIHDARRNRNDGAASPLQIMKNTEAFVGDRKENARTVETYGKQAADLRSLAAKRLKDALN